MDFLEFGFFNSFTRVINSINLAPFWFLPLSLVAILYNFIVEMTGYKVTSISSLPELFNPYYGVEIIPGPLFNFLVKIPLFLADLCTAYFLYLLFKKNHGEKSANRVASLYYLNPITIWISSVWGQADSLAICFTIISLYCLFFHHDFFSIIFLLLASFTKIYPMIIFIPMSIYYIKKKRVDVFIRQLLIIVFSYFTFIMYDIKSTFKHIHSLYSFYVLNLTTFKGIFGYGLSYWSLSLIFNLDIHKWAYVSLVIMITMYIISIYVIMYNISYHDDVGDVMLSTLMLSIPFFLGSRYISEPRCLWLIPFLIYLVERKIIHKKLYYALSLLVLIYVQKNFPFYLLPISIYNLKLFKPFFQYVSKYGYVSGGAILPSLNSSIILSIVGTLFSIILFIVYIKIIKTLVNSYNGAISES